MKTIIIVQARMTSTRLPGKVLLKILDKSLVEYQIERLRRVRLADKLVVATTVNDSDLPIVQECSRLGIDYFRGSEDDLLSRYYLAACQYEAADVVRITSDCPLIDPEVINKVIGFYQDNRPHYDYVSNVLTRTYPRGMDTEVFSFKILEEACMAANSPAEREHVTPFIYQNPQRFSLANVANDIDLSQHRWTVDTVEDFQLIKNIVEEVYPVNPLFSMNDVIRVLDQHPGWSEINRLIEQKKLGD